MLPARLGQEGLEQSPRGSELARALFPVYLWLVTWNPLGTRKAFLRFFLIVPGSVFVPWGKFQDQPHMTFRQLVKGGTPFPSAKMAPTVSAPEQLEARLPGFATSSLSFHGDPL